MIVSRKPCYMRKYQRYNLRDSEDVRVIISSLGITGECQLDDISMNGMGVLIEGLSFSVIDESVVTIRFVAEDIRFDVPARVIYSTKLDKKSQCRRYGMEFLVIEKHLINALIEKFCQHSDNSI